MEKYIFCLFAWKKWSHNQHNAAVAIKLLTPGRRRHLCDRKVEHLLLIGWASIYGAHKIPVGKPAHYQCRQLPADNSQAVLLTMSRLRDYGPVLSGAIVPAVRLHYMLYRPEKKFREKQKIRDETIELAIVGDQLRHRYCVPGGKRFVMPTGLVVPLPLLLMRLVQGFACDAFAGSKCDPPCPRNDNNVNNIIVRCFVVLHSNDGHIPRTTSKLNFVVCQIFSCGWDRKMLYLQLQELLLVSN